MSFRRTSRSRSPAGEAGKEKVPLDSLLQIGANTGLPLGQAIGLGDKVLTGEITGDALEHVVDIKPQDRLQVQHHSHLVDEDSLLQVALVPQPADTPLAAASAVASDAPEEKHVPSLHDEFLDSLEAILERFRKQLKYLCTHRPTEQRYKLLKDTVDFHSKAIIKIESFLSALNPVVPLEDLTVFPDTIQLRGFHRWQCNRDFKLDKATNLNGKPVFYTQDKHLQYFMFWHDGRWRLCPRKIQDRDMQDAVRWGAEEFMAEQCKDMNTNCWTEIDDDGGRNFVNIEFKLVYDDVQKPQAPAEVREEAFVVDKTNFPRSQPPKGFEAGLFYHFDTSSGKLDRSAYESWGKTVRGVAKGLYVKVGQKGYLPKVLRGRSVLTPLKDMDSGKLEEMRGEFSDASDDDLAET